MPKLTPVNADMRRAKERCPACARLQRQIDTGRYVPGAVADGEPHAAPRSEGWQARENPPHSGTPGETGWQARENPPHSGTPGETDNSLAQHERERRPEEIICNHCLCSNDVHDDTGPNGQRCCGGWREGPRERSCDWCRASGECRAWSKSRGCPAKGTEVECELLGQGGECTHCTCTCARNNPHNFDDKSTWVAQNAEVQRACGVCLACWSGWCIPLSGAKRKLVGATSEPEEPFAKQWRPGRDADVYVLTGLFDELTGKLPEGSFAYTVFGPSLRYFKGFIGSIEAKHALREAGVASGNRSSAIGEAWSGGGSQHPPEKPAGARKVVAAPLRQGVGADKHFSRQHGRRDHNWQWDMLKSPWSLGMMQKGRLALGVSEAEADEFEEAGIIAFPGHVVKHKDTVKNGGYGKTIGTIVLRSPEPAFVCVQVQGELLANAVDTAEELGVELPPKFEQKGRFKFAINELDAWAMVGGAARNDAEHAVVCGRRWIPVGEPGEKFVRVAFNMRWGWQDDRRV